MSDEREVPVDEAAGGPGTEVDPGAGRLHFEDFAPGRVFELGSFVLDADEIAAFAERWDPQPFHLDPATEGGIIASGWQTVAAWMRLYVDAVLSRGAMLPAPGVDGIRWLRPVRAGARLHGRAVVTGAEASARDPRRGRMTLRGELTDDEGELVMTMEAQGRAWRRGAEPVR